MLKMYLECLQLLKQGHDSDKYDEIRNLILHINNNYICFSLLFGGTVPHYFYGWLERAVPEEASFAIIKKLFIERLIYSPLYTAFTLYMISRLEGKDHKAALKDVEGLYWVVLTSSWKYLTIIQLLNLSLVPPTVSSYMSSIKYS